MQWEEHTSDLGNQAKSGQAGERVLVHSPVKQVLPLLSLSLLLLLTAKEL